MDGASRDVDLRTKGEFTSDRSFGAAEFGEDAGDAARTESYRASELRKEGGTRRGIRGIEGRIRDGVVTRLNVDSTVQRDRGGTLEGTILLNLATGKGDVAAQGRDEPRLLDRSSGSSADGGGRADVDIEASQTRIARGVGTDADLHPGHENGLAVGREDGSPLLHIRSDEHDATAGFGLIGRAGNHGSGLHGDVAVTTDRGIDRIGREGRSALVSCWCDAREEELGVGIVEKAAGDEVVVDRQRGGHQRADIHLAGATENDAVAVDHVDLARCLDRAEDLARSIRGIVDLVESDPFVHVATSGALVVAQGGLASNIEGFPAQ